MILLVDIGNSSILFGLADKDDIVDTFRLKSIVDKTSDEYLLLVAPLLKDYDIEDIIISSVVPLITSSLRKAFIRLYHKDPIIIGPGMRTGVQLKVDDPKTVGSDIICDVSGLKDVAEEAIIVDLGTATKYIYMKNQVFYGVSIAPGVSVSLKALLDHAALLPNVELICPKKVIGTSTVACIQSGVVYGAASQVDGIIERMKEEIGKKEIPIFATGGLSELIVPHCRNQIKLLKNLTLTGLLKIYKLNR